MSNDRSSTPSNAGNFKLPPWLVIVIVVGFVGFSLWKNSHSNPVPASGPSSRSESSAQSNLPAYSGTVARKSPEVLPDEDEPSLAETSREHDQANPPSRSSDENRGSKRPSPGPLADHRNKSRTETSVKPPMSVVEKPLQDPADSDPSSYQIQNQSIRDLNGNVVFKGTIDLKPTLDRIERGEANRHRNDGTSFQNREGRLPRKPNGYYKEYVHPTPGEKGPGPQRIIIGQDGEVWYTADHYKTFKKIKPAND